MSIQPASIVTQKLISSAELEPDQTAPTAIELSNFNFTCGTQGLQVLLSGADSKFGFSLTDLYQGNVASLQRALVEVWSQSGPYAAAIYLRGRLDQMDESDLDSIPSGRFSPRLDSEPAPQTNPQTNPFDPTRWMQISPSSWGMLLPSIDLEGESLRLVARPHCPIIWPELGAALLALQHKFPDLISKLDQFIHSPPDLKDSPFRGNLPSIFSPTNKYYHLASNDESGPVHHIIRELEVPEMFRFTGLLEHLLNQISIPRDSMHAISTALNEPPLPYVLLYTNRPGADSVWPISTRRELHAAIERKGQPGELRAYTWDHKSLQSHQSGFEPIAPMARNRLISPDTLTEFTGRHGCSLADLTVSERRFNEALFALTVVHALPALNRASSNFYKAKVDESMIIAGLSVPDQTEYFMGLQGRSDPALSEGAPVIMPRDLKVYRASTGGKAPKEIVYDYHVTQAGYATSIWDWRCPSQYIQHPFTISYRCRWHTKVPGVDYALPGWVVSRSISHSEHFKGMPALKQVLLSISPNDPQFEQLIKRGAHLFWYSDGSVWISENQKKKLHGALDELRQAESSGSPDPTKLASLRERAELNTLVGECCHFAYNPYADSRNFRLALWNRTHTKNVLARVLGTPPGGS